MEEALTDKPATALSSDVSHVLFRLLQVMLCNPVCILGYTIASWRFFRERIEEEELSLIHFFAEDYVAYKRKVPTGLPFISGIRVN